MPPTPVECTSCHKLIIFAKSLKTGKPMPIDQGSAGQPGGNMAVWYIGRELVCRVLTADQPLREGEKMGLAHWASCPRAKAHRTRERER